MCSGCESLLRTGEVWSGRKRYVDEERGMHKITEVLRVGQTSMEDERES